MRFQVGAGGKGHMAIKNFRVQPVDWRFSEFEAPPGG